MNNGPSAIRIGRTLNNLSQAELAAKIGRDQSWISRLERGLSGARVSTDVARKIADALSTPPEKLFTEGSE
jgi:transcriptional regulator with XRE-family HTH domain